MVRQLRVLCLTIHESDQAIIGQFAAPSAINQGVIATKTAMDIQAALMKEGQTLQQQDEMHVGQNRGQISPHCFKFNVLKNQQPK